MSKFDNIQLSKINDIKLHVEGNSKQMDDIVNEIITTYVDELDKYVKFIDERLCNSQTPPTDQDLDDFCLNLSTLIYFASGMCESLGIRDDIAKAVWKEMYNTSRDNLANGTVADKNSIAELESQQEQLVSICYTRAYKIVKAKVESAQELLSSCKKVMTRRMNEAQLTNLTGGN